MATTADAVERPRLDPPNILWFFGGLTAAAGRTRGRLAGAPVRARALDPARGARVPRRLRGALARRSSARGGRCPAACSPRWRSRSSCPAGRRLAAARRLLARRAADRAAPGVRGPGRRSSRSRRRSPACSRSALVRFPFVLAVVAAAVAAAGQLLLPIFVRRGRARPTTRTARSRSALALLAVGLALDRRRARRAAFWWYVFGLVDARARARLPRVPERLVGLGADPRRRARSSSRSRVALRRATWGLFGVAGFFAAAAHYLDTWFGTLGTAFALAAFGLGLVGARDRRALAPRPR